MGTKLLKLLEDVARKLLLSIEEPSGVKLPEGFDWVRDVVAVTPVTRVSIRVMGSEERGIMVAAMLIGFAAAHREMIRSMPIEDRVAFISRLLYMVSILCPLCRIGLGGSPVDPKGIIAEIVYVEPPGSQRLADDLVRLYNVFILVNALIWEKFPSTAESGVGTTLYT